MESGQCLEDIPDATITQELCLPSHEQMTKHIEALAKKNGVQHLFVASDIDPRLSYIKKKLGTAVSHHGSVAFLFIYMCVQTRFVLC